MQLETKVFVFMIGNQKRLSTAEHCIINYTDVLGNFLRENMDYRDHASYKAIVKLDGVKVFVGKNINYETSSDFQYELVDAIREVVTENSHDIKIKFKKNEFHLVKK